MKINHNGGVKRSQKWSKIRSFLNSFVSRFLPNLGQSDSCRLLGLNRRDRPVDCEDVHDHGSDPHGRGALHLPSAEIQHPVRDQDRRGACQPVGAAQDAGRPQKGNLNLICIFLKFKYFFRFHLNRVGQQLTHELK